MNRLSKRERILLAIIVGIVVVFGNLFLISALQKNYSLIDASLARKQVELKSLKQMFVERDLWAKRAAWVTQKQPKLANRDQARVTLLDEVKTAAKAKNVMLENPALGSIEAQPAYQSVSVNVETKSSWSDLIGFMSALQQPDRFIVFETANLQIDTSDSTKMRGRFRIAKWYAP